MPPWPQARPMPRATIAKQRYLASRLSRNGFEQQRGRDQRASTAIEREGQIVCLHHVSALDLQHEHALRPELQERDDDREHDHLGELRVGPELDEGVEQAEREGGDDRAAQLAEPADDHDEERVDDVVGAERRPDRPDQGQRDAGDAGQARADEERELVDPAGVDAADRGELAVLHHRPHPPALPGAGSGTTQIGDHADDGERHDEQPGVRAWIRRRSIPPSASGGAVTCTFGAPKRSRATCCRIRLTPQVTSSVSSGRP